MANTTHDLLGEQHIMLTIPLTTIAQESAYGFLVPFKCKLIRMDIIPQANITGAASHYFTWTFYNRGTDGTGTTSIQALAFSSAPVTATAFQKKAFYAPATELAIASGTYLSFNTTKTGNGLATPVLNLDLVVRGN